MDKTYRVLVTVEVEVDALSEKDAIGDVTQTIQEGFTSAYGDVQARFHSERAEEAA